MERATTISNWEQSWSSRPKMRGWLHAVATPVVATAVATLAARRPQHRTALVSGGAGLVAMFATSAGYHRLTRSESAYRWTRPADHAAIFAAIAGTATPLVASVTSGHTRAVTLSALWGTAGVAAAQRVREVRSGGSGGGWTYVALGWMGAALVPALARRHGLAPAALLAAGGAAYTTGAVLFSQRKGELAPGVFGFHELWHTLTLVGAGLHLGAIALATRDSLPIPSAVTHPTGTMTNVRSLTRQNNQPNHQ